MTTGQFKGGQWDTPRTTPAAGTTVADVGLRRPTYADTWVGMTAAGPTFKFRHLRDIHYA